VDETEKANVLLASLLSHRLIQPDRQHRPKATTKKTSPDLWRRFSMAASPQNDELCCLHSLGEVKAGRLLEDAQVKIPCRCQQVVDDLGLDLLIFIPFCRLGENI
jgi:hypothetical protein